MSNDILFYIVYIIGLCIITYYFIVYTIITTGGYNKKIWFILDLIPFFGLIRLFILGIIKIPNAIGNALGKMGIAYRKLN